MDYGTLSFITAELVFFPGFDRENYAAPQKRAALTSRRRKTRGSLALKAVYCRGLV